MKVNNVDLNVKITGDKMPFIWAHGLMCSMEVEDATGVFDWDACSAAARCIRYDARGHGRSRGTLEPADYSWTGLASDMLGIADALGIKRFIAGGQSMGCATSVTAALAAPQRIAGLVLATPPTAWETRAAQSVIYDFLAGTVEKKGLDELCALMQQRPLLPQWLLETRTKTLEKHMKSVKLMDPGTLIQILRGAKLCNFPPREELKKLKAPALILAWVDDTTHPVSVAEDLHALLPASRLVVSTDIAGVNKWPKLIRDFVAALQV
jgi:3-oxoadipate enol-lactonase